MYMLSTINKIHQSPCQISHLVVLVLFSSSFMGPKATSNAKMKGKGKSLMGKIDPQPPHDSPSLSHLTLDKSGNILMKIHAKPGARTNAITGITEQGVGVQINAPPVDGEANSELIKYMSKLFGLRKSDVSLDKGSKSRQKTICIQKDACSMDHINTKLKEEESKKG